MKIVFMGTPEFATLTLFSLIEKHEVVAVVTQPDKARGRGQKLTNSPVKDAALKHNIPVFQPTNMRGDEIYERLKQFNADAFVVVAFGQLLPKSILDLPKFGCFNVHGSLLPKYRGAAPIHFAVLNGETKTGVTIMKMDVGLDTGDMLLKAEIDILPTDTTGLLHDKLAVIGANALIETLTLIENGTAVFEPQDNSQSTYAGMISKEMGQINWAKTSAEIVNLIRGLNPTPTAFTTLNGEKFKIWNACTFETGKNGENGEIVEIIDKKGFVVKTIDGAILVTEIQAHGGKRLSVCDYLRGHKIELPAQLV